MTINAGVGKMMIEALEPSAGSRPNELLIGTTANIYGYGLANVAIAVSADHFSEIAEAMMAANPDEATKAFGCALKDGLIERAQKPLRQTHTDMQAAAAEAFRRRDEALR